jgi:hypothetical protein
MDRPARPTSRPYLAGRHLALAIALAALACSGLPSEEPAG